MTLKEARTSCVGPRVLSTRAYELEEGEQGERGREARVTYSLWPIGPGILGVAWRRGSGDCGRREERNVGGSLANAGDVYRAGALHRCGLCA